MSSAPGHGTSVLDGYRSQSAETVYYQVFGRGACTGNSHLP